jgi:hypothetical protein
MEGNHREFTILEIDMFNRIDKAIEDNDHKYQADVICELVSRNMLDEFDVLRTVSMISSIVCNLEEDIEYAKDGLPSDNCKVMVFSEQIEDMYFDNYSNDDILSIIKDELIIRERYELLNEIKKNEENS